jgi:FkbM family methyltransferase
VDLYLPWSHLLPDYAKACPTYGQNLVEMAGLLRERLGDDAPLLVLDVGANIGDSAAQIVARTSARVLCVEGDPYWAGYLRRNVGNDPRVTIAEVFLAHPESSWSGATPVRNHGTTHFVEDAAAKITTLTVAELRQRYPDFDALRLVKTDTDGLDVALAPAIAETWQDVGPVIMLEFDPRLARNSGFTDPDRVWEQLAALGYTHAAVWDNGGEPLGQFDVADGAKHARVLDQGADKLGYYFWDVAVRRAGDTAAAEVFDLLVPQAFGTNS